MANMKDPMFDEVIKACRDKRVKKLMGSKYDWNDEIIAQFIATLYVQA